MIARFLVPLFGFALVSGLASAQKDKEEFNSKVIAFARKNIGKQVGDGECAALAVEGLKEAGAKPNRDYKDSPNEGDYVWGELVYGLQITASLRTESTPIGTTVKAGDIIQFRDAKFAGRQGGGTYTSEAPHHTAVVVSVGKDLKSLEVLQQNVNGKKTVAAATIKLGDLQSGWVKIYRPQKP
jgi:hypothetical protein